MTTEVSTVPGPTCDRPMRAKKGGGKKCGKVLGHRGECLSDKAYRKKRAATKLWKKANREMMTAQYQRRYQRQKAQAQGSAREGTSE